MHLMFVVACCLEIEVLDLVVAIDFANFVFFLFLFGFV